MNTPILETDRLILRPFRQEDAADVFECWERDFDVAKYMFWTSHNDIEKTKEWISFELGQIEKDDWYRFALALKETKELIGTALIYYEEEVQCWEIGYNLGKKYWGKGYTTEAMKRVLVFAQEELGISEIVGRYAKENPASGHVMEKLGFQYEKDISYECNDGAVLREGIQCRLAIRDEVSYEEKECGAIRLVSPSMEYAEDIMEFRKALLEAKDEDSFAGCGSLRACETTEEWLRVLAQMENADTCPAGSVTSNTYLAVRMKDNRIVGMIDLRHHIDHPILGLWGGHMGYSIRPSERGKGYAKEMLKLNLQKCKARNMEKVMITCSRGNDASERTILANGGVFEKEVLVDGECIKRYWVTL